ncbi:MAG: hypothetical protein Q9M22_06910 [Mariprofundaceae bacterium]|nr:hypothetical protein [Mariprofundaceae bacterium]
MRKMLDHEHKKARALAVEMLNNWDVIFIVIDHPNLPLTNNKQFGILFIAAY